MIENQINSKVDMKMNDEQKEKYINKNIDKSKTLSIRVKKILKMFDINDFLINKRNFESFNITFTIPNEIYEYIKPQENRTKYVFNLFKKYRLLLKNIEFEIFFNASELFRFVILLDYLEFINDVKISINSTNLNVLKIKNEVKNGYITEIQDGIEYLRYYVDGKMIKEKKITSQEVLKK
jgi:hypothetical protein